MMEKIKNWINSHTSPKGRKVIVGIVGGVVILIGIMMIFVPGPAFVVIPAGVAILASEFKWARRCYDKVKDWLVTKGWIKHPEKAGLSPESR
jgi:hypothetical protein